MDIQITFSDEDGISKELIGVPGIAVNVKAATGDAKVTVNANIDGQELIDFLLMASKGD